MNVLEHPALFSVEVATHECGGNGMASRNIRTLGVAKPGVTGLQFAQQVLNFTLDIGRVTEQVQVTPEASAAPQAGSTGRPGLPPQRAGHPQGARPLSKITITKVSTVPGDCHTIAFADQLLRSRECSTMNAV